MRNGLNVVSDSSNSDNTIAETQELIQSVIRRTTHRVNSITNAASSESDVQITLMNAQLQARVEALQAVSSALNGNFLELNVMF